MWNTKYIYIYLGWLVFFFVFVVNVINIRWPIMNCNMFNYVFFCLFGPFLLKCSEMHAGTEAALHIYAEKCLTDVTPWNKIMTWQLQSLLFYLLSFSTMTFLGEKKTNFLSHKDFISLMPLSERKHLFPDRSILWTCVCTPKAH